ncbi:MAG: tRNA (adenosine(37)-N6)-dimethylallyltransferase MiaA [Mycoplasmatota bacterium]|nr:tRNA (adenosine(37)-N6)-dimethylallyltransferase MiaA [Mycoplasmatota bacterium]
MKDIIVIIGPTGVGKTKLSIELAKKLDAEIINGDSVAIYKELNIGSAKPTVEERENIVHHLLDIRHVLEQYSVYDYQQDVRQLIATITKRHKRIIIVGGTGLYIKAALYNYNFTARTTTNDYTNLSNEEILKRLSTYTTDELPHKNNRKRLIALLNKYENNEVITHDKDELLYPVKIIGLTTDRAILYNRINQRVDHMMANGLLKEVESLKPYYKASRILNTGIGYKEFVPYFLGEKTKEAVVEQIKLDSRRYAKRQYTFFKHQFDVNWFSVDFVDFTNTINAVTDFINK